jgi:hypothetical protein
MGLEGYTARNTEERESSFRDEELWKDLFTSHLAHLSKTYRGLTPDGETITEEWLHREAKEMADAQFKMKMKQLALENKLRNAEKLAVNDGKPVLTESTKKKLLKQKEEGNIFAEKVPGFLDEDKK